MNNYDVVLNHLKKHGKITSWEAIQEYGITRLSHYIYELRKAGYTIEHESVNYVTKLGNPTHYFIYKLVEKNG